MIADVIKLVRIGALVFVLLPMKNTDFANAYEVTALNKEDRNILSVQLRQDGDMALDKIERLLTSVKQPYAAEINDVSVTEMLSLRVQTWKCGMDELRKRRNIASALLHQPNLKTLHRFAEILFGRFINSCFNNVEMITALFSKTKDETKSTSDTVKSFLHEVLHHEENLQVEITNIDYKSLVKPVAKYLKKMDSNSEYLKPVKASCKEVLTRNAMLSTLATCLEPGPAQDEVNKLNVKSFTQPTCSALDKKLHGELGLPDCLCGEF